MTYTLIATKSGDRIENLMQNVVVKKIGTYVILAGFALLACISATGQQLDLPAGPEGKAVYDRPLAMGPRQALRIRNAAELTPGLAFYTASYLSMGTSQVPFNIVGTDPSLGAATTTIPTVIIPIKVIFADSGNAVLDGTNAAAATMSSPIFQVNDYTTGGADLGATQFGDAIQRAQFWQLPGFSQAGYHMLLSSPTIAPTITVTVPAGKGKTYATRTGGILGVVDNSFLDSAFNTVIASGTYSASQLPIFVTDNVFEGAGGIQANCCVLGYHASQGPPIASAQTWIYAAYTEPGTFLNDAVLDVQPLSHEVAEWINDPFVGTPLLGGVNLIPPAELPGTGGVCIINFETGDPLEFPPVVFTQTVSGKTYHLQDEVFLSWYLHGTSFAVNNSYTYLRAFTTPSTLCGPG
jgi:hypothetical protein